MFDLKRSGVHFAGDVDVEVRPTARSRQFLEKVTKAQPLVDQVILAAVQCDVIQSQQHVRSVHYVRPVVDGLDMTVVSFRAAPADRLLLI